VRRLLVHLPAGGGIFDAILENSDGQIIGSG